MSFDDNVIDLNKRRKKSEKDEQEAVNAKPTVPQMPPRQNTRKGKISDRRVSEAPILDMSERRQEIINNERRAVKRTILTEFIGAFIVVPQRGLCEVALYDISEDGLGFDLEFEKGCIQVGEEIAMRIYMNQRTYFPFIVKMENLREILDEGVYRHGVSFVKDTINDTALQHFVRFIETVSSGLERDNGDILVSNLRK